MHYAPMVGYGGVHYLSSYMKSRCLLHLTSPPEQLSFVANTSWPFGAECSPGKQVVRHVLYPQLNNTMLERNQ